MAGNGGYKPGLSESTRHELVRRRYERIASVYDILTAFEGGFSPRWREKVWAGVGGKVLEVGVGTGKNIPYYPPEAEVVAVDFSPRMLRRALRRALRFRGHVHLMEADVNSLPFPPASFDAVVATLLLSTLPDPLQGLTELRRVLKPGGRVIVVEYTDPGSRLLRPLKDFTDWLGSHVFGPLQKIAADDLRRAGFRDIDEELVWFCTLKLTATR